MKGTENESIRHREWRERKKIEKSAPNCVKRQSLPLPSSNPFPPPTKQEAEDRKNKKLIVVEKNRAIGTRREIQSNKDSALSLLARKREGAMVHGELLNPSTPLALELNNVVTEPQFLEKINMN
ncbi:hypothetical protein CFP56_020768 [Quercus suber]|uniref:Uncharacterized protein n=1 Tax=Quercus suber TaxID=58331 RepID=A0AAW0KHB9_QUESU